MHSLARRLPAIFLVGLALIAAIVAAGLLVRLVEVRLLNDTVAALKQGGFHWAQVSVNGLQVRLAGTAPSEADRFRAITAAGGVVDSASIRDTITVAAAVIAAPRFSVEILRNDSTVSLIGLIPRDMGHAAFLDRVRGATGAVGITDLLDSADHAIPAGWERAVDFGLAALATLPRSKISIAADQVRVAAIAADAAEKRRLETELTRRTPDGLRVALDITAPRPTISPFLLRFVVDPAGRARFDACSADTPEARAAILKAAAEAGLQGNTPCVLGIGAPSPRWGEAAVLAIGAVKAIGGGTVTMADADISLVALEGADRERFDSTVGRIENALPAPFTLEALLPEPETRDEDGTTVGPPEFVATRGANGAVELRGRLGDELEQAAVDSFAKALFGATRVTNATRLDPDVPPGWSVRVLAALEALEVAAEGSAVVRPERVAVIGRSGDPEASARAARLLSTKLGQGAVFDLDMVYDEQLDPLAGLPTAQECVEQINAALAEQKISFAPGSATIDAAAAGTLDRIAELMKQCGAFPMEVGGHTDSQGREEMNQQLSQSRAEAVLNALLSRRVLTSNLTARGYGESLPIADNGTEAGREANRRIEFKLIVAEEENAAEGGTEAGAENGPN